MTIIVITGGIASGKSSAARLFRELGVSIIDSDQLARELVAPGEPGLQAIVTEFGAGVLASDGSLDRPRMRALIFRDATKKRALEAILHPRIMQLAQQRCAQAAADSSLPYVLLEVPLYAEIKPWPWVDRVLLIDCSEANQLARLSARDGINASQARRVLAAQSSRAQRLAIADDIIHNDADLEQLRQAVRQQHEAYLRRFGRRSG